MKEKLKRVVTFDFLPTIVLYILFMVLTVLLVFVDVSPIGLGGSHVGLATVNGYIANLIGTSLLWYNISQILGYIVIGFMVGFLIYGFVQWLDRQKLRRVDKDFFVLGFLYFLIFACTIIFNLFIVNFRPVLITEDAIEISYPSTHILLAICVMISAMKEFQLHIKNKIVRIILYVISSVLMVAGVASRILSGVQWFTDILGSILLGATLVTFYFAMIKRVSGAKEAAPKDKRKKRNRRNQKEKRK